MKHTPELAVYLAFCMAVRTLCNVHKVSATSWWRTDQRNHDVGGLPTSLHKRGLAVDVVLDLKERRAAVIATARSLGFDVADEGDHIHLEYDYT